MAVIVGNKEVGREHLIDGKTGVRDAQALEQACKFVSLALGVHGEMIVHDKVMGRDELFVIFEEIRTG